VTTADKVKYNVHMADFFKISPLNGAMNYFDSAIGSDILSVGLHYQIGGGICTNLGEVC